MKCVRDAASAANSGGRTALALLALLGAALPQQTLAQTAQPVAAESAASAPAAGYVKTVSGEVQVVTGDKTVRAVPGTPVYRESRIKTGREAQLGLILRDDTMLSLGPDTEMQVSEFAYVPEQGKLSMLLSLGKGTLHYISGVIAKLRPEAVSVKTPTGMIGVRGTRFVVKVDE